jgi:dipeptidyl aminopeptidase/acylaminoacyl peptidase
MLATEIPMTRMSAVVSAATILFVTPTLASGQSRTVHDNQMADKAPGLGSTAPAEVVRQERPWTVDDALALKAVGQAVISPDGRWVAYVVTRRNQEENKSDSDVWLVSTEGGDPLRLTHGPRGDQSPQWAPDGSWLAFLSDRGGSNQVHGILPGGGEAWAVTDWEPGVGSFRIAPDGSRIAFAASAKQTDDDKALEKRRGRPMVWDSAYATDLTRLWVAPLSDRHAGKATQSSPDEYSVGGFVWSPDSRGLAWAGRTKATEETSPSRDRPTGLARQSDVYVQDQPGGEARRVTSMAGGENPQAWVEGLGLVVSGSGQSLGTFNSRLWLVPSDRLGEPVSLTAGLDENAGFVAATPTRLLVQAGHATTRGLYQIPLEDGRASGEPEVLTDGPHYYSGFSVTDDQELMAFVVDGPAIPPNVHTSSPWSFSPKKLTAVNEALMAELLHGEQIVVRWPSKAGGEEIEGVLTLPVGYQEGDPVPLLLVIHGGPSGNSANRFNPGGRYPIQVFAGLGYASLQPNYRGSTGYGERFRGLNRGDISGRDWIDIDSGVDYLVSEGIADPDRLGIMGWSFGGHHTFWGITRTERFKAASAGAGANDLISMYSQTDLPGFYHTYLGPKPWEDFDFYEERSAYRYVERVTTPLLIQVGERDERVPAEQSIQFYEAMSALGKAPAKLVLYPGQGHGIRDIALTRDLMERNVAWFTRWIPVDRPRAEGGDQKQQR